VNAQAVHEVLTKNWAGDLTFPEVVRRLLELGAESYLCDFATGAETVYMHDGQVYIETIKQLLWPISENFSRTGLVSAIDAAQSDTIRYPEFMKLATAGGVIAYWAFLTGGRVIYFGRKGEQHIEEFPPAKP